MNRALRIINGHSLCCFHRLVYIVSDDILQGLGPTLERSFKACDQGAGKVNRYLREGVTQARHSLWSFV